MKRNELVKNILGTGKKKTVVSTLLMTLVMIVSISALSSIAFAEEHNVGPNALVVGSGSNAPLPLFTQCPAIGADTGCGILITFNADGTTTIATDPGQPPFDGIEDTLVGVQNNAKVAIPSTTITGTTSPPIFGFDGDGLCAGYTPGPTGCPFGLTGYEGPGTSFTGISADQNTGTVVFTGGLAPGASAYFSLEGALDASSISLPPTISLTPLTATNPIGTSHTVTATILDSGGNPQAGLTVTFSVISGPNTGVTGTAVTDASGIATFTYTGKGGPGTDTIQASFVDAKGNTINSNTVTKDWTVPLGEISGLKFNDINGNGVQDKGEPVLGGWTINLLDSNGNVIATATTAPYGTYSFPNLADGTYTVAEVQQLGWKQTDPSTGTYSETITGGNTIPNVDFGNVKIDGKMTGGGSVFMKDGTRVTHGLELNCNAANTPNNLEVNWGKGNKFHLDTLNTAICYDDPSISPNPPAAGFDTYVGSGVGSYNGVPGATATWTFTDAGEPGTKDSATLQILDAKGNVVLDVSGLLNKGNQQAHPP